MTFYVIVFFVLWGGFLASVLAGRKLVFFDCLALVIFIVVAGQRFETGNDWLVYKDHYAGLQALWTYDGAAEGVAAFEPLYVLSVWVFGLFLNFQAFLLIVSIFNGVVLYRFARVFRANFSGVVAIYYAWLYLATQMATIRYSIAMSIFMLAVMHVFYGRKWLGSVFVIFAAGFHAFSIALAPVLLLIGRRLDFRQMGLFLAVVGAGVYFLFSALMNGWEIGVPFFDKLSFYLHEGAVQGLSLGLIGYIGMNLMFLVWARSALGDGLEARLVEWSVFYLVFFQIVLWALPIFWNRAQVLVLTIQACVISRHLVERRHVALFLVGMLISFFVFWKTLSAPAFVSYVPYQSYFIDDVLLGSAREDGEARYFEALEQQQLSDGK